MNMTIGKRVLAVVLAVGVSSTVAVAAVVGVNAVEKKPETVVESVQQFDAGAPAVDDLAKAEAVRFDMSEIVIDDSVKKFSLKVYDQKGAVLGETSGTTVESFMVEWKTKEQHSITKLKVVAVINGKKFTENYPFYSSQRNVKTESGVKYWVYGKGTWKMSSKGISY